MLCKGFKDHSLSQGQGPLSRVDIPISNNLSNFA